MSQRRAAVRHSVTVEIAGEKHVLRSDVTPEYTQAVAAHVDATIRSLGDSQPLDSRRTVTLAALFITDELFRAREESRRLREELEQRTAKLAELLERAAAEGQSPQQQEKTVAAPMSSPVHDLQRPDPAGNIGSPPDVPPSSHADSSRPLPE